MKSFLVIILLSVAVIFTISGCGSSTSTTATYDVAGTVSWEAFDNAVLSGVVVTLEGSTQTTTTDANGQYTFSDVEDGTHTISFYLMGWTFYPTSESITVSGAALTQNATAELTDWDVVDVGVSSNLKSVHVSNTSSDTYVMAVGGESGTFVYNLGEGDGWVDVSYGSEVDGVAPTSQTYFSVRFGANSAIRVGEGATGVLWEYGTSNKTWSEIGEMQPFLDVDTTSEYLLNLENLLSDTAIDDEDDDSTFNPGFDITLGFAGASHEVYVVGEDGNFTSSNDRGVTWTTAISLSPQEDLNDAAVMTYSGDGGTKTYTSDLWVVGAEGGIWQSADAGVNWTHLVEGIPVTLEAVSCAGDEISTAQTYIAGSSGLVLSHK
ncbi:carboxypeptidase-like regulatory domain-containing protein [Candidatus Margulisiibacteriota bacterium]